MRTFIFSTIFYLLFLFNHSFSFQQNPDQGDIGTGGREDSNFMSPKNSNLKKGKDALKQAIKLNRKDKVKKANKKFEKALKYFVSAYKENPDNIEVISFLGLTYNETNDFIMAEIYYKEALLIDPNNILINKRLGELYFNTKRIILAKERLEVLNSCNCKEYISLKNLIYKN